MDEAMSLKLRGYLIEVLADSENRIRLAMDILHEAAVEEHFDIVLAALHDVHRGMVTNEEVLSTFLQTDPSYRDEPLPLVVARGRTDYRDRLRLVYRYDKELLQRMMEALGDDT